MSDNPTDSLPLPDEPHGPPSPRQAVPANGFLPLAWLPPREPSALAATFDPSVPHPARVYNYWLGGKDHYPADRKVADAVLDARPEVMLGAHANREFLIRAVEYLAQESGIGQFLDIGAGLPAPACTHQIAQAINPASRIVYVDNDPMVLAHSRALLASTPQGEVACLEADLRHPDAIVEGAAKTLDLAQPAAVLLLAVLHFIADADNPGWIVAALAEALAPGSFVVITHGTADFAPEAMEAAAVAYNLAVPTPVFPRSHRDITALFADLPLVAPGVVPISGWRPRPFDATPAPADLYAGMARLPGRGM